MRKNSSLLIEEYPLIILPSLAKAIGLNEAIILQQVKYWETRESGKVVDGRRWVYNSVPEWQNQFPFWSFDTVRRALKSLRDLGVLDCQKLSDNPFDKTLYYAINYQQLATVVMANCNNP